MTIKISFTLLTSPINFMLQTLKKSIALNNPLRLLYHKIRAVIANYMYGFSHKDMTIIWVTGTNGKTTTCNIIAKWLREQGKKVFMFTTVNIILGDDEIINNSKMTSPDVFILQQYFKKAKDIGCEVAIIETASHGIKMHRVWGLNYDIAVLTNITQDHLDLHGTMKDYVNTKLSIFKKLIWYERKPGVKKTGIINVCSRYSEDFLEQTYDSLYKYGNCPQANINVFDIEYEKNSTKFNIRIAGNTIPIETKLKGDFNIENILAAVCVFMSFGIEVEDISKIVAKVEWIPGRMEAVPNELWADIYVDYAHSEDALQKVLENLKKYGYNKIITVFWATGDRDTTKRPAMGKIVDKLSDIVILTQDDDYTEKPEKIISQVQAGINRTEGENFWIIPSRKEAIEAGISALEKWDCLLIAGKWDEHTMITNFWPIEWNDRDVVEKILASIDENKIVG